jgi:hypothetical protein
MLSETEPTNSPTESLHIAVEGSSIIREMSEEKTLISITFGSLPSNQQRNIIRDTRDLIAGPFVTTKTTGQSLAKPTLRYLNTVGTVAPKIESINGPIGYTNSIGRGATKEHGRSTVATKASIQPCRAGMGFQGCRFFFPLK